MHEWRTWTSHPDRTNAKLVFPEPCCRTLLWCIAWHICIATCIILCHNSQYPMGLLCFYDSIHYTNQTCSSYEFLFVVHFYKLLPHRPNSLTKRHGFFSELAESLATHGGNLYRFLRPGCWKPSSSVARFKGTSTISWMTSSFANEVSECTISVLPP